MTIITRYGQILSNCYDAGQERRPKTMPVDNMFSDFWNRTWKCGVYYNRHHRRRGFITWLKMSGWTREGAKQEAENRKVPRERVYKEHLRQHRYNPECFLSRAEST